MPWSVPRKHVCKNQECGAQFESTAAIPPDLCPACRKAYRYARSIDNRQKRREGKGAGRVRWSSDKQKRKYNHLTCSECGAQIWTSSNKGADFMCIGCKRALGLTANGREGRYTTLAAPVSLVVTMGQCPRCKRGSKRKPLKLINDKCDDCRWYDMQDVDPDLSDRARKGKGGEYDFVKGYKEQ